MHRAPLTQYLQLLESLRFQRSIPGWRPYFDRALLAEVDDVFERLSDADAVKARALVYLGWPQAQKA